METEAPELDQLLAAAMRARDAIDRVEWVRAALRWIEKDLADAADSEGIARAHTRMRFLLQVSERDTDGGRAVRAALTGLLNDLDLEQLMAVGAIPRRAGFMTELYERCLAAVLPQPDFRKEPALLIGALLGARRTIAWIDLLPAEDARRVALTLCRTRVSRETGSATRLGDADAGFRSPGGRPCVRYAPALCRQQRA